MSTQPHLAARMENRLGLEYPVSLSTYDTYAEAQRAVDFLADKEFPVEDVMIVGTDLKQVERVSGRLTTRKVLLGGLLSGIWIGVFVGVIFAMFDGGEGLLQRMVSTVLIGAVFGLVWAWLGYRSTGGERDFTSVSQVVASRYEVLTEHRHAQRARELLDELDPMRAAQEKLRRSQAQARAEQERMDREQGGQTAT
ncbi:general stress protein [Janibacter sp. GS2]|uniref:general stress protein n=1 Tax=Janibacter sp. GS2 TaxID=3442646 RepID=UPI003EBDD808